MANSKHWLIRCGGRTAGTVGRQSLRSVAFFHSLFRIGSLSARLFITTPFSSDL